MNGIRIAADAHPGRNHRRRISNEYDVAFHDESAFTPVIDRRPVFGPVARSGIVGNCRALQISGRSKSTSSTVSGYIISWTTWAWKKLLICGTQKLNDSSRSAVTVRVGLN